MPTADSELEFEALLDFLKRNRGFDFTGYKRSTLMRRVQKRMDAVEVSTYSEYLDRLEAEPDEFSQLFNTLLINVTRFFRDEAPWELLQAEVVPALIARRGEDAPLRIWSAGCASGEEAYSLAMVLCELLGVKRFKEQVKIYATDADEEALAEGRAGFYSDKRVEDVPELLRAKYFEKADGGGVFRRDLRRSIIFGRNDLVQDAPISRIDLLACRNTLMYFNAPAQRAILSRFHFALAESGVLFLGRAETLLTHTSAFAALDLKRRLFVKVARPVARERMFIRAEHAEREGAEAAPQERVLHAAFEAGGEAQLVVARGGHLVLANARARATFNVGPHDLGRPLQDLEISYRPVELRSIIEQAYSERRAIEVRDAISRPKGMIDDRHFVVVVTPLSDGAGALLGASIVLSDVTESRRLSSALEESRQSLETAYEELQSTNEELETTNEELQSTVEELETTNEEMQSTNEELETMNEELQSTNEELQTMNDELQRRGEDLNELNAFLEGIYASMRGGVVVLDCELRVLVWSAQSEEYWGLRSAEVMSSSFLTLDIGLPVEVLAGGIRASLTGRRDVARVRTSAVNRRGKAFEVSVGFAPMLGVGGEVRGVVLTMEAMDEGNVIFPP